MAIVSLRRPSTCLAVAICLGLLLPSLASCASKYTEPMVAIEDFCSDPRILVEMQHQDPKLEMGQPWCKASKVSFRRDGELTEIAVAQVLRGWAFSGDVGYGVSDSIIRLPEDRLVNLGPNAPVPVRSAGLVERHLTQSLDMQIARPATYQFDRFYSAFLELTKRGYCWTYEMKPPFEGQLSECSRLAGFYGDVSYMPGTTTWQQAKEIACGFAESGCPVYSMSLAANAQGRAFYVVELQAGDRCQHYTIDAMTGAPSRRGQDWTCGRPPSLKELLEGT